MTDALFYFLLGIFVVLAVVFVRHRLTAFTSQQAADYSDGAPRFDLREHLEGKMICDGVIFGPTGRVTSSFTADFDITWDDNVATMHEEFTYSNGDTQTRQWVITLEENGNFSARADDVPGIAKGIESGPAVIFRYPICLPPESGGYKLWAFDCMYVAPNGTVVNRSQFRKFGIKVAELIATIHKIEEKT